MGRRIDYANSLGCYCLLYTNCTLVDERAAQHAVGKADAEVRSSGKGLERDVVLFAGLANSLAQGVLGGIQLAAHGLYLSFYSIKSFF